MKVHLDSYILPPTSYLLRLTSYLKVDVSTFAMPTYASGVAAICAEFERAGTDSDRECLHYVLRQRAGSSELVFANGNRKRASDASNARWVWWVCSV